MKITLLTLSQEMLSLKEPTAVKSVMAQRDTSSYENLEKLATKAKQLAPKKEKQVWTPTIIDLIKRESFGSGQITTQSSNNQRL